MPRKIGWENKDITGGRGGGADKERRFRGVKGSTFVIRVVTECEEFRKHFIDDVLEPNEKTGEPRGFNMICAKTWDDESEDYDGDCLPCDKDYDVSTSYIAGILVLGVYKGRSKRVQRFDPENAVHWWDFGPDKYRQISDIVLDLQRGSKKQKLSQVELTIKCEDENYQKLTIQVSQADPLMTKKNARDYIEAWKEEGPQLIEDATKAPTKAEQKRRMKPKKRTRSRDEDDGDGDDDSGERKAKPRRSAKKGKGRRKPKDEEPEDDGEEFEDADDGEDVSDDDLDDLLDDL